MQLQMTSYYLAKFGGHRQSGSGNKIFLACHVTLKDHAFKGSFEFMGATPSW